MGSDVLAALSVMLEAGWKPAPEFFDQFLSAARRLQRWYACRILAQHNQVRLAAQTGKNPRPISASQAATAWLMLANWQMALAEPVQAVRMPGSSAGLGSGRNFYTSASLKRLRARWLLDARGEAAGLSGKITARLSGWSPGDGEPCLASLNGEQRKSCGTNASRFSTAAGE